ncbi:MAG: glycosyltransferase family 2 protein [Bacteroidia bacterium]
MVIPDPHRKALPEVSVVILNWNGRHFLEEYLPSVLNTTYPNLRIIIADNASTDGSVEFLQQQFPEVEIIVNATNEGFAGGYNTALKQIRTDYYVLLNSDVEVTKNWISPVIEVMEQDKNIVACQPKIRMLARRSHFEYAGASGGYIDAYGYPFCRGRLFSELEEDEGQYNTVEEVFWTSGACMFIRPNIFHRFGGFDEDFFAHMEEIDLCWRMKNAGHSLKVVPQSVVYHVGGGSLPKDNPRKTFLNFRNSLIMLQKNLPLKAAFSKIFTRMVLDGVAAMEALAKGKSGFFFAILRAHLSFYFYQPKWISKRKEIKKRLDFHHVKGVYRGSIVKAFFVNGKKKFSDLNPELFSSEQ